MKELLQTLKALPHWAQLAVFLGALLSTATVQVNKTEEVLQRLAAIDARQERDEQQLALLQARALADTETPHPRERSTR